MRQGRLLAQQRRQGLRRSLSVFHRRQLSSGCCFGSRVFPRRNCGTGSGNRPSPDHRARDTLVRTSNTMVALEVANKLKVLRPGPKAQQPRCWLGSNRPDRNWSPGRLNMRRFTRLTNAFSKRLEYLSYAVALDTVAYNFVRRHRTLRMTPAMAAGVVEHLYDYDWLDAMIADRIPKPQKPGPKVGTKFRPRKRKGLDRLRVRFARPARDAPRFFGLYYEVGYVRRTIG